MVPTARTFRLASPFSAVHQGRRHVSAVNLWPVGSFKRKICCVFCSGSHRRLRGWHLHPPPETSPLPPQHLFELRFKLIGCWGRQLPSRPQQPTPTPRLQLAFRAGSDYQKTRLIPELHQQLSCFICLYSRQSRIRYHPSHLVYFYFTKTESKLFMHNIE